MKLSPCWFSSCFSGGGEGNSGGVVKKLLLLGMMGDLLEFNGTAYLSYETPGGASFVNSMLLACPNKAAFPYLLL